MNFVNKNWETLAPDLLHFKDKILENKFSQVARLSKNYYFGNKSFQLNNDTIWKLTYIVRDKIIAFDSQKAAKLQAKINNSPVYFHYYNYRANQSLSNVLTTSNTNYGE